MCWQTINHRPVISWRGIGCELTDYKSPTSFSWLGIGCELADYKSPTSD